MYVNANYPQAQFVCKYVSKDYITYYIHAMYFT